MSKTKMNGVKHETSLDIDASSSLKQREIKC
jgi:hypothetical protein